MSFPKKAEVLCAAVIFSARKFGDACCKRCIPGLCDFLIDMGKLSAPWYSFELRMTGCLLPHK